MRLIAMRGGAESGGQARQPGRVGWGEGTEGWGIQGVSRLHQCARASAWCARARAGRSAGARRTGTRNGAARPASAGRAKSKRSAANGSDSGRARPRASAAAACTCTVSGKLHLPGQVGPGRAGVKGGAVDTGAA
jgi:hypothetical protein